MGLTVPTAFGGAGADTVSFVEATQVIAQACASSALVFVTHLTACTGILVGGNERLKAEYLPAMAKGNALGAFAVTESGCGANILAVETSARHDGQDYYRVTGSKVFITSGEEADVYLVAVRTGTGPSGLTLLLIEKGTPGLTFGRKHHRLGMNGTASSEILFDDCMVPIGNVVGKEGAYMAAAMPMSGVALLGAAAIAVGLAQAALGASIEHAKTRKVNGQTSWYLPGHPIPHR